MLIDSWIKSSQVTTAKQRPLQLRFRVQLQISIKRSKKVVGAKSKNIEQHNRELGQYQLQSNSNNKGLKWQKNIHPIDRIVEQYSNGTVSVTAAQRKMQRWKWPAMMADQIPRFVMMTSDTLVMLVRGPMSAITCNQSWTAVITPPYRYHAIRSWAIWKLRRYGDVIHNSRNFKKSKRLKLLN